MAINIPDSLKWAHPLVQEWFVGRFGTPTEPQTYGWPEILKKNSTLIAAPTGSGKTLAAFLACLDGLVRQAVDGRLKDRTEVVYVSPLKALSNDINKNLKEPLSEIRQLAEEKGIQMDEIRTAVRTGDTLAPERRLMLKKPPHILVTTPESLYILITAEKSRQILKPITTLIVDEIHAIADDKRGSHLTLTIERLEQLTEVSPVRIGLSATQKPIEEIARYLVGSFRNQPVIVDVGHRRKLDLSIEVPASPLGPISSNEMWEEIYDRITKLAEDHRSTLVFVNTRRLAERIAHHLEERLGEDQVASHHGSLSRKMRLDAEEKLKEGKLKVLVATASLELGIDIGAIDLVCQIGSPKAIAVALQRIGRAGHWRGAVPKGRIFATTRDELVECAALVQAIKAGDLDRIIIPEMPLDILAQQIVATCAAGDMPEDELFQMVCKAYPYRNLARETFDRVIEMLSQGFAGRRSRFGVYLHHDRVNKKIKGRRGSRLAAITSGGAIPENALFTVLAEPERTNVGTLDEDFAIESNRGDIILLGTTSWRIRRIEGLNGRVIVEDARGAPPTVPFWRGEAPARTIELSRYVSDLRQEISKKLDGINPVDPQGIMERKYSDSLRNDGDESSEGPVKRPAADAQTIGKASGWLKDSCNLDDAGAEQIIDYIIEGRYVLGDVPSQETIIAERFFDESGGMQLVIHSPFGGRINRAWGLALRKRFCRSFNLELQAAATEDGLIISLSDRHSFPLADVFQFLHPNTLYEVLEQAVLATPFFTTRWRWDATRSLAILRFSGGKKVPPQIQRMRAEDLLASVFPDAAACQDNIAGEIELPDHPLITEVMKDVLTDLLDIDGLREILNKISDGKIRCIAVDTPVPSQFSHEILNANPYAFLDDAPLEERRARAVELRRILPDNLRDDIGQLDQEAIAEVKREAWPDVRNADELADVLQTLIALPEELDFQTSPAKIWQDFMNELIAEKRGGIARVQGRKFWLSAECKAFFDYLYPDACYIHTPADLATNVPPAVEIIDQLVSGWILHIGPTTCSSLSDSLSINHADMEQSLFRLESTGLVLRGHFANSRKAEIQWCNRTLLSRIHRLTIGSLRKNVKPVTAAQFVSWLFKWQHLLPGHQLKGLRGTREVLSQLQGFEIPANAWEGQILAKRLNRYDSGHLDDLCLTGHVGWGRLSPHPATLATSNGKNGVESEEVFGGEKRKSNLRRVIPTSVAPIAFFMREDSLWIGASRRTTSSDRGLSHSAQAVFEVLKDRGACFFTDIVRASGQLKSETESALWELVTAGLVTADAFDNLRSLIDPRRRSGQGRGRHRRPRHSQGRWTVLYTDEPSDRRQSIEAVCWMLLKRYGVVFRDLLARESIVPPWRELLVVLRALEARGEIRGGRFVEGFLGEQFALPIAVESLRESRTRPPLQEPVTISAADPLNLVGIILPGSRVPAVSSNSITIKDGVVVSVGTRARGQVKQLS